MERFALFILLLILVTLGFCVVSQLDFLPKEISISGSAFLEDNVQPDGIKIRVLKPKAQIFAKEIRDYCLTDASGRYYLKRLKASKGVIGEVFLLWLSGNKEWKPYLRLRVYKEGYLPTDIIIVDYNPKISIPPIILDDNQHRRRLNQIVYEDNQIKILKNVMEYYFCPAHNYFWFYPRCYDFKVNIPTEEGDEVIAAKIRLIIQPLYTTFGEEIKRQQDSLGQAIQDLIPEISKTEVDLHGGEAIADAVANQSLITKLNLLLIDSKVEHIQLISAKLQKVRTKTKEAKE